MSHVRFTELLSQVAPLWPDEIDISDGKLLGESGGVFPSLSRAWNSAELQAEELGEFHALLVWAVYGTLHERARLLFAQRSFLLRLRDCAASEVERRLSENLFSPTADFGHLRSQYINDLGPN
jgi:hypothetical protein